MKTWRGAATEDEKAVLAVRTAGKITECEWYSKEEDETYSSEDRGSDIEVVIDEDDTLCKLVFKE